MKWAEEVNRARALVASGELILDEDPHVKLLPQHSDPSMAYAAAESAAGLLLEDSCSQKGVWDAEMCPETSPRSVCSDQTIQRANSVDCTALVQDTVSEVRHFKLYRRLYHRHVD
jgi:hypothetical protein